MQKTQSRLKAPIEPEPRLRFAVALRDSLRGYDRATFRADLLAGIVVGIVSLPLAMALAIASGVPPQHGLYTAIVAGALIPLCGGSRVNVSGPTAAFVVLLAPVSHKYGVAGLALASLMAGVILAVMGLARLGRLIEFIPHPVTTGFTAGIAVVIATLQVKDFLGLSVGAMGEHYWERVTALARALPSVQLADLVIGVITLVILMTWRRISTVIPSPLVAVTIAAILAVAAHQSVGITVATIGSRFSFIGGDGLTHAGIPSLPPMPHWPWSLPGPDGEPLGLRFGLIRELMGPAFAIAMLGAIESLLCAVVADGMAGTRHDPDAELLGQGIGNIVGPFFGGIAATGAIARTATNVRSGGKTPIAAVVHALFVLSAMLLLGRLLAYLPMAALAALLLVVAWNMSDAKHFARILRIAPKSDVFVLLACFLLTVVFDMVIAVTVGVVLAALLFMRRMAEVTTTRVLERGDSPHLAHLPDHVLFYEIAGPLFFGAAAKAASTLYRVPVQAKTAILHVGAVPVMDVSGLVALETAIASLQKHGLHVILAGLQPQPLGVLERAGVRAEPGRLSLTTTLIEGVLLATHPPPAPPQPSPR